MFNGIDSHVVAELGVELNKDDLADSATVLQIAFLRFAKAESLKVRFDRLNAVQSGSF